MDESMELNPREAAAKQMRDQTIRDAVEAKIIPGRSFLEQPEFKGATPTETSYGDDRPSGFKVELPDGRTLERDVNYVREKGPDDKWRNTDELEKISERIRATKTLDDGMTTLVTETGKDLHQEHGWTSVNAVSKNEVGVAIREVNSGNVTEGEKIGEKWENVTTFETKGGITKKTRSNSGIHMDGGKLVPFKTEKVNFIGPNGEHILYRSREFGADGKEKDDRMMEDIGGNVPPDFQEW
ncbi:MAG: hypothetical protein WC544_03405 [Patescibacteria group bacterium]